MNEKRLEQLKEAWVKNVVRILGYSREHSEELYNKIKPYRSIEVI